MSEDIIDRDLTLHLDRLRVEGGDFIRIDQIAGVVRNLLQDLKSREDMRLYKELESLAIYIRDIKAEIASVRPDEIRDHYLPSAADELDAIVGATENATNAILAAAETIEEAAGAAESSVAERLNEATTAIYEACTFQDITGQRISKVVKALKEVEGRITSLAVVFRAEIDAIKRKAMDEHTDQPRVLSDTDLLNGPQRAMDATTRQKEIDAMFHKSD